jgi:hypothetical protein
MTVSSLILSNIDKPAACNKTERKFFALLEDATLAEQSDIDGFAAFLLDKMCLPNQPFVWWIIPRSEGVYSWSKQLRHVVHVLWLKPCPYLKLGANQKSTSSNPEPQLIAGAIAAFTATRTAMRLTN